METWENICVSWTNIFKIIRLVKEKKYFTVIKWLKIMFELNWLLIPTLFFFNLFGKGDFKSNHPVIIFVFSKYLVRKPSLYSCWNFLEMYHGRVQKKFTANSTRSTTYIYVTSTFVFRMLFPGFPWSVWLAFGIYPAISWYKGADCICHSSTNCFLAVTIKIHIFTYTTSFCRLIDMRQQPTHGDVLIVLN